MTTTLPATADLQTILDNFAVLDEWDDRYRYLIEIGRTLEGLPDADRTERNKVRGCASQVWLVSRREAGRVWFAADSDAHIMRGLIAILLAIYNGERAEEVRAERASQVFSELGLASHLTPQRSNGFRAMVDQMVRSAEIQ